MNRCIKVFIVLSCVFMFSQAQAQLSWGLKGGMNLANVSFKNLNKDLVKVDNRTGFFVGPMLDFKFPVLGLGFDASLLYSQTKLKFVNKTNNDGVLNRQHALDIPVNLKWRHSILGLLGFYLAAGPDFSFNLKSDNIGNDLADLIPGEDNLSIKRKAAEIGVNFGAGLTFFKHLEIGFNYNLPLTDSARSNIDGVGSAVGQLFKGDTFDTKNKKWQISAAYLF